MSGRRVAGVLALLIGAAMVLPAVAHACPVCFDPREENRAAFFLTTVFLTLLPLLLVAGVVLYLRQRARQLAAEASPPAAEPADVSL